MTTGFPFTDRKRTGNNMWPGSTAPLLPIGSFTVRRTISSQCMITFTVSCWNGTLRCRMRPGSKYWTWTGAEHRPNHSCGCSKAAKMGFQRSSCMAILRSRAAAMQRSSWKATADIWKQMDIRDTTISAGYQPLLLLGAHPSILYRCCSQRKTVWLQPAGSVGSSVLQPVIRHWGLHQQKSIRMIMKSESSCVSRRKNLFWRPSSCAQSEEASSEHSNR